LLQIPAGFGALRFGNRRSYLLGFALVIAGWLASAFSVSVLELVLAQFLVGAGTSLVGATGFSLIASFYPAGKRGGAIGLFWGSINGISGFIGLPLGSALGLVYGWNFALIVGSVCMLIMFAVC